MPIHKSKGNGKSHHGSSKEGALLGTAFLTLIAFLLTAWVNNTFHPVLGGLLPLTVLGIGFVSMIADALA